VRDSYQVVLFYFMPLPEPAAEGPPGTWTRRLGQSRVFCLQSGHDNATFGNPSFRMVLQRGIAWLAEPD
jgi:type 1 glutamine amidotransferase